MLALVLHVDMDAFFAAVEIHADPRLDGKPLVVGGGPGGRGVVTTASYAARDYGVRSGMPLFEALRRCPHLLVLPVDPRKFVHASLCVLAVLDRLSPRVEAASIDEAYVGFPPVPAREWEPAAARLAAAIRREIRASTGLPASVGAAVNKLQAKMATQLAKPDGSAVLPPERFLAVFGPHPVSVIPGVGPRSTEALASLGIRTVEDLARADPVRLRSVFGVWGGQLRDHARGEDARGVFAEGEGPDPKSAGHETTFAEDVADPRILRGTLWLLADRVARRLRSARLSAHTVCVRYKVGNARHSRQRRLSRPIDEASALARVGWDLLEPARRGRALRLLGVAGMALDRGPREASLFPEGIRSRRLLRVEDRLRDRFGEEAILPAGVFLGEEP